MTESLINIIKQSKAGDETAQRELYELFRVKWYMTAMRYGKSKQQSEDIFQEGLIQIFKDLKQYDIKKSAFATWSSRVMINSALRFLKKFAWQDSFKEQDQSMHIHDTETTVFEKISAKEITRVIQKLPLGYRLVFNLFVIEGYKHHEIANMLGISEGTSKSQLAKARRALKKKIESQLIHRQ